MSQNIRCQSCQGNFDGQNRIPTILPCKHNICAICAFDQFQKNQLIRCVYQSCQMGHKINPIKLPENTQMLKYLESKGLLDSISLLESQQATIQSASSQLAKQQANLVQQIIQHINQYIFKDSQVLQKDLKQVAKVIKQQLYYLRYQQNLINRQQQGSSQQFQQQSYDNPQLSQKVQKLQADAQRVQQQLSQVSTKAYEELANVKSSLLQVIQVSGQSQSQIQQLCFQIQNLQQEKRTLQSQITRSENENNDLTTQLSQLQTFQQYQQTQIQTQTQAQVSQQQLPSQQPIQENYCQQQQPQQPQQQKLQQSQVKHISNPCKNTSDISEEMIKQKKKKGVVEECAQCRITIFKDKGCDHMTCTRCKYEWCYICKKEWLSCCKCEFNPNEFKRLHPGVMLI